MIRLTALIEVEGKQPKALSHESDVPMVVVGRDRVADFQIPHTTVSRQHARISQADGAYLVEDMGSTHGTCLNGKRLAPGEKRVLRDGDLLELSKVHVTCHIESSMQPADDPEEGTHAIAARAVQGILGQLGDGDTTGPFLRILSGADEGDRLWLEGTASEWVLGRSKECAITLNDQNVSRRHAVVRKDWHGYAIADLGSKHGVLVNDVRIKGEQRLTDQDELRLGPVKLLFFDPDAALMASLADVPGFEMPNAPASFEEESSVSGEAAEPNPEEASLPDALEEPEAPEPEDENARRETLDGSEADAYAAIDPDLLQTEQRKFPSEYLVVGIVSILIVACVLLLLLIL